MLLRTLDPNQWTRVKELLSLRLARGTALTFVLALLARLLRGVSLSGACAGFVISLVLYVCGGPGAFGVLTCVFVLTSLATKLGDRKKQQLGTAEQGDGRTGSQVFANLAVAAASVTLFAWQENSIYLLAAIAALAEAAADTVSSEYGQARGHNPRLITTWKLVAAGTDGAVSAGGSLAGTLAAFIVSVVSTVVGLLPVNWIAVPAIAGILGMFCDSLLGATLERRRVLNNNAVNFLSTLLAAIFALLVAWLRPGWHR